MPSLPFPNWFKEPLSDHDQAHRERVARTWKAEFGPVLTRLARRLGVEVTAKMQERANRPLDGDANDPEFLDHFRSGAFPHDHPQSLLKDIDYIYKCVGVPEDFADCLRDFAHSIELTRALPLETHQYFRPRGSAYGFRWTVRRMLEHGATPPTRPVHPGEAAAMVVALRQDVGFQPEGWQDEVKRWLKHGPAIAPVLLNFADAIKAAITETPSLLEHRTTGRVAFKILAVTRPRHRPRGLRDLAIPIENIGRMSRKDNDLRHLFYVHAACHEAFGTADATTTKSSQCLIGFANQPYKGACT